ncbi:MAG: hypothetical protein KA797_02220 [Chitinophagales bacterium]|nr:hypothetical protein [Chitinophagales bacterium]
MDTKVHGFLASHKDKKGSKLMVDYVKISAPSIQTTENQISESALFYKKTLKLNQIKSEVLENNLY